MPALLRNHTPIRGYGRFIERDSAVMTTSKREAGMSHIPVRRGLLSVLVVSLCVMVPFAGAGERTKRRQASAAEPPPIESVLLMEAGTGAVLYEKDIHKQRAPASMVKMMLMLIVMEKLRAGELHLS